MAIPESQLETWAHRSQTNTAVNAHTRIREFLNNSATSINDIEFTDYLQGSYANYTNIIRDHDVDIVVQMIDTFYHNADSLLEPTKSNVKAGFVTAPVSVDEFKRRVITELRDEYGIENIEVGKKAISVPGVSGQYMDADVLVCCEYRHYQNDGRYIEGIAFNDTSGNRIVNFPHQHKENGQRKHNEASQGYKPTIRIFKNIRRVLADRGLFDKNKAPSYFIQGLLYNVPSDQFYGDISKDFMSSLVWLVENTDEYGAFWCQNGMQRLFGNTPEQWNAIDALEFLRAVMGLWTEWS